jgi:hypothetical protein
MNTLHIAHTVGYYNVGKEPRGRPSGPISIFRSLAMDYHHQHQFSIGHFLSVPFDSLPLRDMEALLQNHRENEPHSASTAARKRVVYIYIS